PRAQVRPSPASPPVDAAKPIALRARVRARQDDRSEGEERADVRRPDDQSRQGWDARRAAPGARLASRAGDRGQSFHRSLAALARPPIGLCEDHAAPATRRRWRQADADRAPARGGKVTGWRQGRRGRDRGEAPPPSFAAPRARREEARAKGRSKGGDEEESTDETHDDEEDEGSRDLTRRTGRRAWRMTEPD